MSARESELNGKTCDRCGRPAEIKIDDQFLCEDCYQVAGSCCPEFGGDDAWEFEEARPDSTDD